MKTGLIQIDRVRLRKARLRKLMTQVELARRIGVAQSTIYRIELGQQVPHISTLRKLLEALEIDASEIVIDEEEQ